ncbi:hypothetical protein LPB86_06770 [Pedobacter sp. MC2016-14]|uniref:hypothetical protein n=1 Tax=Pedobacter sp. MC2016-14 TaxID=2897327 RepID=UPI001E3301E5|nr:hypothetical protein [Pedobacter sp. MC2016-14]MCD0487924.1 hypothetical protein [Pedobacter sp. MC2016-14]
MKENLSVLMHLVHKELSPAQLALTEQQLSSWLKRLPTIAAAISSAIWDEVFSLHDCPIVERHIFQVKSECVMMNSKMLRYQAMGHLPEILLKKVIDVLEAIVEEIDLHHSHYFKRYDDSLHPIEQESAEKPYKINYNLSVDSLACFNRVIIEAGMVDADPRSELYRFLADSCKTKGKKKEQKISVYSIAKAYNNVEPYAIKVIKDFVLKMLNILNRGFVKLSY